MNIYTFFVIFLIVSMFFIQTIADLFNIKNISNNIPREFKNCYENKKYEKSQKYLKTNTKFSIISSMFFVTIQIVFIIFGGFNYLNTMVVSFKFCEILTGLCFVGILFFIYEILKIPFSAYFVFVIEEKFGFNKMNVKIFISDLLKSWIITLIIGSVLFSTILLIFTNFHKYAWLYSFVGVVIFKFFVIFIAPIIIMPIFNKYTPLEDGELKSSIEKYIKTENFKMNGLFKIDGSKRSTKSNAFFTGIGKFRRIVLFDTLIQKHSTDELISVLAHEMGHFKLGHILKDMIFSFISTLIMLFILSILTSKSWIYNAFLMNTKPIYAGIIFFSFLYEPISLILSIISNYLSRKHEYDADKYAIKTYGKPDAMVNALKKLSIDNLSNLYPHKLKILLDYSHPPVLDRIKAINEIHIMEKK